MQPWHVYVLAFVFGTGTAFDAPARQAFVNEMVDRDLLPNAVGLNSAAFNLARMIGPALAGVLIAWLGSGVSATGWVILVNAASYVAVIVSLTRMRASELVPIGPLARGPGQLRDGMRYVRSRPDIMLVMAVVFCAGTFGLNFQMTTALMATEVYGKGAGEYGLLGSILAVGSLLGSLLAARRKRPRQRLVIARRHRLRRHRARRRADADVPDVRRHPAAVRLRRADRDHGRQRLRADLQRPEMRGRVMALYMAIFMGGTPIGAPLLGWIAEHFGARWTLVGGGALTALGTVVAAAVFARRQGVVVTPHLRPHPHVAVAGGRL